VSVARKDRSICYFDARARGDSMRGEMKQKMKGEERIFFFQGQCDKKQGAERPTYSRTAVGPLI